MAILGIPFVQKLGMQLQFLGTQSPMKKISWK
jgi:hypothetical protein